MLIRVGAVDDEYPALKMVEQTLKCFEQVRIIGLYTDPEELLEGVSRGEFDLVLIDMEMPEMHGMELARRIYAAKTNIHIVFVTAYEQYALEAFDVDPLDYLLKPITNSSVARALERYSRRKNIQAQFPSLQASFYCFGRFVVKTGEERTVKFRNSKSRELIAYLFHHHGEAVSKSKIIEALWYDGDAKRSQINLHSTVYQLRKDLEAFGLKDVIEQEKGEGGSYRLRLMPQYSDLKHFLDLCKRNEAKGEAMDAVHAIELYGDGYLSAHEWEWAQDQRLKLEEAYDVLLTARIKDELSKGRYRSALPLMLLQAKLNPYHEDPHIRITAAYILNGDVYRASTYYKEKSLMLIEELGLSISIKYAYIASEPLLYMLFANH